MDIETKNAAYGLIPELGVLVNAELEKDFAHLVPEKLDEKKIIADLKKELSDNDIEEQLFSLRCITLNISEQCNFRCTYCTYSGNYPGERNHRQKSMSFSTARKAIDYLIAIISKKERKSKINFINIGHYGGEALLEFKLLQDVMAYTKKRFREKALKNKFIPEFRLNSNGYLLKDDIVDFLVEWDVTLDVSLDGPQGEHDKFRVTTSGDKTWETIVNNLNRIKERYPGYYKNKIKFLATLHPFHDYEKIDRFYLDNPDDFNPDNVTANFVNTLLLKEDIKKEFEKKPYQSSLMNLIRTKERLDGKLTFNTIGYSTKFTQMCFPGAAKLFIDSDGKFHICERIKTNLPIGDVDNGYDYEAIRSVHRQWADEIIRLRCWECPAWSFCGVCAAQSEEEKGVRIECTYKDLAPQMLKRYIEYKEKEAGEKEPVSNAGSIKDYIRQLD